MPVKKVHVKGKRKAPLPPTSAQCHSNPTETTASDDNSTNSGENSCINDLQFSFNNNNKRKKAAPLPPSQNNNYSAVANDDNNNELNNFSMFSINNKFDKNVNHDNDSNSNNNNNNNNNSKNASFNLNIFEPIHHDLRYSTKQNNDTKRYQITEALNKENDQVWICDYCTLKNPFWKIVCDACERIKPYNTPNMPMSSTLEVNYNKDIPQKIDNINVLGPVKIRTKTLNVNKDTENVLKRNSMRADLANNNRNMQLIPEEQKMVNGRPASMCFSPNELILNTQDSLELEKERIRSLIRAMNNRTIANNFPTDTDKPLNDPMANSGAIKKYCKFQDQNKMKHFAKYDAAKEYNFPVKEKKVYDTYLSQTDDSKASLNSASSKLNRIEHKTKLEVRLFSNLFDQTIFENPRRIKTEADLVKSSAGSSNKLTINVYVNFNKAVEIKIDHRMTLGEFEKIVSKNVAPSRCPKIYFNGLLLRDRTQPLISYGIKDRSSLYVNTENVVAHTRNDVSSPIKYLSEKPKEMPIEDEIIELEEKKDITNADKKKNDTKLSTNTGGDKYLIEHIQYDRYLVERLNPEQLNLSKTKYRGVYNYNPRCNPDLVQNLNNKTEAPKKPIIKPETVIQNVHQPSKQAICTSICDSMNQYMELLSLDERMDLTKNTEKFECSICLVDYQPFEGVMLRNCLHTFCKDCVRNSIIYSDEAEVKCPYIDREYSCEYFLQDREIKALLSKTEYDDHLAKSLRIAENQIENSFHCLTPNCNGWSIIEDDVNVFKCPICSLGNCLTCRVIHDGLDCKQYQTMMQNNIEGNPENATTVRLLEEMVNSGEAMKCPTCRIVLMKKWGCDWLKCSMCKTEICWITRGPRWGPGGKGDTSKGCRCGVNGNRCHPKCTYCH